MKKRMFLMLAVVIVFLAVIGSMKFFQIKAAMAQGGYQPPPEAVTTVVTRMEPWDQTLNAIGTVVAVNGVTVSADLPGVVEAIAFDSGRSVSKGDLLSASMPGRSGPSWPPPRPSGTWPASTSSGPGT